MNPIKNILLACLGVTVVTAGGYVYLNRTGQMDKILGITKVAEQIPEPLKKVTDQIKGQVLGEQTDSSENNSSESDENLIDDKFNVEEAQEKASEQIQILTERSVEVKEVISSIVTEVKESSDSSSLQEKAFEYGQYLYCQGVVKEYEAQAN